MRRLVVLLSCSLALDHAAHAAPAASWRAAMSPADLARDERLLERVEAAFDTARGGYVGKGGVPCESAVVLALANGEAGLGSQWDAHARFTLEWMRALVDSNGGGYYDHARAPDGETDLIDKSTIVHARRLELLITAWRASGDPAYRTQAAHVVDFVERILLDPRGGFVVSQVGDREPLPEPNGRMIHAWLEWASVTADPRLRDFALRSIDRVWSEPWVDGVGLLRRGVFGESRVRAQLVDQAELGRALVLAARLGARPADRERAIRLGELLLARFEDTEKGGFKSQVVPAKNGGVKKASRQSDENASAVWFLEELTRLTGDTRFRAAADRAAAAFDDSFAKLGLDAADWALATRAAYADDLPSAPAWHAIADEVSREPVRSTEYSSVT